MILLSKVILIGDVRVGKTSFLYSLLKKSQTNIQPTMGIEFMTTTLALHGKNIKVQIWDTTGAQNYRSITSTYYKKAQGVLLIFDISNKSSFENIKQWNIEVNQKSNKQISKLLVGNKLDLMQTQIREVNEQDITNYCIDNQMTYKQTSALKGYNVNQTIIQLIEKIYENGLDNPQQPNQYTSLFQINPNTTILNEPTGNNGSHVNNCYNCC